MCSVEKSSSEKIPDSAVDLSNLALSVLDKVQKKGFTGMLKNGLLSSRALYTDAVTYFVDACCHGPHILIKTPVFLLCMCLSHTHTYTHKYTVRQKGPALQQNHSYRIQITFRK
jgi:hypothetical protein